MRSSVAVIMLCSAILAACSEPTSPEAFDMGPAFSKAPVHSVTGGGRVDYTGVDNLPDGYTEMHSISARSRPDGSVEGQLESHWPAPYDVKFHGAVDCLKVEGNTATVGFTITRSDNPTFPKGSRWVFRIKDDGAQDAITSYGSIGLPALTCQTPRVLEIFDTLPLFALTNGNFNVR